MKTRISILILALFFVFSLPAHSQMSRKEKKEWKKKAKELKSNPEELKAMTEENESLKSSVTSLNSQVENLKAQLTDKNSQLTSLKAEVQEAEARAMAAVQRAESSSKQPKPTALDESGAWFKVQVGAFENINMSEYFKNNPNFSGETTEEGLQRITLGRFRDYWEADTFKKVLRQMGVKEAWIVPYKEGVRVPLKELLENLSAKPE
jgi:cell division protein FtsN